MGARIRNRSCKLKIGEPEIGLAEGTAKGTYASPASIYIFFPLRVSRFPQFLRIRASIFLGRFKPIEHSTRLRSIANIAMDRHEALALLRLDPPNPPPDSAAAAERAAAIAAEVAGARRELAGVPLERLLERPAARAGEDLLFFDSEDSVASCLRALARERLTAAPLVDVVSGAFLGFLSIENLLAFLLKGLYPDGAYVERVLADAAARGEAFADDLAAVGPAFGQRSAKAAADGATLEKPNAAGPRGRGESCEALATASIESPLSRVCFNFFILLKQSGPERAAATGLRCGRDCAAARCSTPSSAASSRKLAASRSIESPSSARTRIARAAGSAAASAPLRAQRAAACSRGTAIPRPPSRAWSP